MLSWGSRSRPSPLLRDCDVAGTLPRAGTAMQTDDRPLVGGHPALLVEALRQACQELGVRVGLGEAVQEQLDALVRADRGEHPAHGPDHLQRRLLEEELLAPGARA